MTREVQAVRATPSLRHLHFYSPFHDEVHRALLREAPNVRVSLVRHATFHPDTSDQVGPIVHADLQFSWPESDWARQLLAHPTLRSVDLSGCDVSNKPLAGRSELPELETLILDRASLEAEALAQLAAAPALATLSLRMVQFPSSSLPLVLARGDLQRMGQLRELDLAFSGLTDGDLRFLAPLAKLRALNLKGNNLTDAGLVHLRGLSALEQLDLRETKVTPAGIDQLQQGLPFAGAPNDRAPPGSAYQATCNPTLPPWAVWRSPMFES